jgi:hypothetical protein
VNLSPAETSKHLFLLSTRGRSNIITFRVVMTIAVPANISKLKFITFLSEYI